MFEFIVVKSVIAVFIYFICLVTKSKCTKQILHSNKKMWFNL